MELIFCIKDKNHIFHFYILHACRTIACDWPKISKKVTNIEGFVEQKECQKDYHNYEITFQEKERKEILDVTL